MAGTGVAVVVVRLDGVESLVGACVDPAADPRGHPLALGRCAEVEERLVPVTVHDDLAVRVPQQQIGRPRLRLVRLGLEGVDVTDVVQAGRGRVGAVAADDADAGRWRISAADLVVETRVERGELYGTRARRGGLTLLGWRPLVRPGRTAHQRRERRQGGCPQAGDAGNTLGGNVGSIDRGYGPASDAPAVLATVAGLERCRLPAGRTSACPARRLGTSGSNRLDDARVKAAPVTPARVADPAQSHDRSAAVTCGVMLTVTLSS